MIFIETKYFQTNNAGACCVSDFVYHNCCAYSTLGNKNFKISTCQLLCSNDFWCNGYSTVALDIGKPPSQFWTYFCFLFTSSLCQGQNVVECRGIHNFSLQTLNKDANCPYPEVTAPGNLFVDPVPDVSCIDCHIKPSSGCFIKNKGSTAGLFWFVFK